jgi:multiple sugar transport system ATP-binding protein
MGIRELAKELKLSVSTVSRALNDSDEVSAETRDRVRAAALEQGYAPSKSAASLRRGRLDIVGLMLPVRPEEETYTLGIFMKLADGLQSILSQHGMDLVMYSSASWEDEFARLRRAAPQVIRESIDGVARTLGLDHLLQRMPRQLSGGQRQRVAMGRAIVRNPKVFLFDEPLSNLDAALRVHMRTEIRKLHQRLGATSVYVTHDQIEAMTMADHVVVLRAGEVEQQGAPLTLYHRPANRFVAGFIGSPSMNFVEATIGHDAGTAHFGGADGENTQTLDLGRALPVGAEVWIGLRPEHLRLRRDGQGLRGVIDTVESTGSMNFVTVKLDGVAAPVLVAQGGVCDMRSGEALGLDIGSEYIHVFDRKTERAL